jgi:hypothetical protein
MVGAYAGQGVVLVLRWMRWRAQLSQHCRGRNRQGGEGECERDWERKRGRGYSLSSSAICWRVGRLQQRDLHGGLQAGESLWRVCECVMYVCRGGGGGVGGAGGGGGGGGGRPPAELAMTCTALSFHLPSQKGGHPAALVPHDHTPPSSSPLPTFKRCIVDAGGVQGAKLLVDGIITASVIAPLRGKRRATPAICSSRRHSFSSPECPETDGHWSTKVHKL